MSAYYLLKDTEASAERLFDTDWLLSHTQKSDCHRHSVCSETFFYLFLFFYKGSKHHHSAQHETFDC